MPSASNLVAHNQSKSYKTILLSGNLRFKTFLKKKIIDVENFYYCFNIIEVGMFKICKTTKNNL